MKKSTLITTIAMIVVVVVALSTATYAWFSSSATAIASVAFETETSGDWTIMQGAVDGTSVTFSGSAQDSITLTPTIINSGLWCPNGEINATISSAAASTTLTNRTNFVSAEKTGDTYPVKKLQTPKMNGTEAVDDTGVVAPFALRLVNVSGTTQTLQLNVTVNAKSTGTNNSMYAAAAVRFYVYEYKGAAGTAYTSGYEYTSNASLNTAVSLSGLAITKEATPIAKSSNLKAITSYDGDTPQYTNVTIANYNVGDISGQFNTGSGSAAQTAIGIESGDKYLTYSFDLSSYAANDFSNIIIYAWIDGWVANASASQAEFEVNFGFISNPVVKAHNA